MSRKLFWWKNSKVKLDQIDIASTYVAKNLRLKPLPNYLKLVQVIRSIQVQTSKRNSKSKKKSPMEGTKISKQNVENRPETAKRSREKDDNANRSNKKSKETNEIPKEVSETTLMEVDIPRTAISGDFDQEFILFCKNFQGFLHSLIEHYNYSANRILCYYHECLKV
jgi:hypothetical protein